MEEDFLRGKISKEYGIDIIIPDANQRKKIHDIIYEELVHRIIKQESPKIYLDTMNTLAEDGAGGIILGCTEIGMLITQESTDLLLFDTTQIHAEAAVAFALA